MEGLFEETNKQGALFQDKKKKDFKKVFKTILVVILIIILLSGSAYGVFYYLTEIRNRDAKLDIIEIAKNIDLNKYTDIEGLSEYFDNINANSYEFNLGLEANSHDLNNAIKDLTQNEDVNIKDFKVNFVGKVDRENNHLQTDVALKHKEDTVIDFQIQDVEDEIRLYGKEFFKEHIGIEKNKLKSILVKEYGLDNDISSSIEDLTEISLDRNYIKEVNGILNSITKSLPEALQILTDENFQIQRNVKVNYRNNSLSAETYTIKLNYQQYTNLIERLKTLSKVDANNLSIELPSLVGKTDEMIDGVINYIKQMIGINSKQELHINMYSIKNNLVKIEFVKLEEAKEDKLAFEVELVSEKNTNEIIISNDELKLKMTITKDNNKIYSKIDIDGKIPIPNILDLEESPVKEIDDEKEKEIQDGEANTIQGERNSFSTDLIITDPISPDTSSDIEDEENPDTPVSNENENPDGNQDTSTVAPPSDRDETQDIYFMEDIELLEADESLYTKKMELKANLSFDRPVNNTSAMNFNIIYNSNQIEILIKADIVIKEKDEVKIDTPMNNIVITSGTEERLKANLKAINEKVYSTFIRNLKNLKIMK